MVIPCAFRWPRPRFRPLARSSARRLHHLHLLGGLLKFVAAAGRAASWLRKQFARALLCAREEAGKLHLATAAARTPATPWEAVTCSPFSPLPAGNQSGCGQFIKRHIDLWCMQFYFFAHPPPVRRPISGAVGIVCCAPHSKSLIGRPLLSQMLLAVATQLTASSSAAAAAASGTTISACSPG